MPTRILLVEDEEAVSLTLQAILSDDGHEVDTAATAEEAFALVGSTSFDVALLDLRLGDADGLRVLSRIKETSPRTVALVLTGYGSLDTAVKAMRIGASDYLLKPCDVGELKAAIARGLAERADGPGSMAEVEHAIAESRKARDDFLELAGQELKTPLAAVIGWAQYAQRHLARGSVAEAREKLDMVVQESRRIARLVEAFTDMVRIRNQGLGLDLKQTDLRSVLELAVQSMQAAYPLHQYRLTLPEEPVTALVDAPAMATVFCSLLENAAKFSPRDTDVEVALRESAGKAIVSIRDEGVGISPAELGGIFEQYERPRRATRRREPGGLGLGLYLSRALMTAHGGTIWAESAGPDTGSTFYLSIPVAAGERAYPTGPRAP